MKLLLFEIKNYKCIEDIVAPEFSNLTTFIGRNSAGKTSIFEALKFIKRIHKSFDDKTLTEIVYGGVEKYGEKFIFINYLFEIQETLRKEYIIHYLNVTEDSYTTLIDTDLFKKVQISIKLRVKGTEAPQLDFDNILLLDSMSISNTEGVLIPLFVNYTSNMLQTSQFEFVQNPKPREMTHDSINKQIIAASQKKSGILYNQFLVQKNTSLQGKIVQHIIENIKSIEAIRESKKQTPMEFKTEVGERGSDLIGLMHTLFNNDNSRFRHIEDICKKIFPDIIEIHPDLLQANQVRILVKKRLLNNKIDLAQEGSGIDQLFIIIWSIATAEKDTIWILDEPELHLHPGAQKLLYDFFNEESENGKQILVATHSMVFIHNSKPEEIYMLVDKEGITQLIRMSDLIPPEEIKSPEGIIRIRSEIYEVLGYEPKFSFEPNIVVFIEGVTDEGVFKAFARILLNKEIDENTVRFIITGSSGAIKSYGPLFVYALMGKKVILIRDNDKENPIDLKDKMLQLESQYRTQARISTPILADNNFHFFPEHVSSIEYYLLNANAIVESSNLQESEKAVKTEEISKEIENGKKQSGPGKFRAKSFLESLYKRHFGSYDEVDTAIAIAEKMLKEDIESYPEIVTLINKICD